MDLETYKKTYEEGDAPGWDAIDKELAKLYVNEEPACHWGTILPMMLGGEDPLDGISVYKNYSGDEYYLHYISYGFSELYYDEKSAGQEYSKFGFELTFRLKPYKEDTEFPTWVASLMQNLA